MPCIFLAKACIELLSIPYVTTPMAQPLLQIHAAKGTQPYQALIPYPFLVLIFIFFALPAYTLAPFEDPFRPMSVSSVSRNRLAFDVLTYALSYGRASSRMTAVQVAFARLSFGNQSSLSSLSVRY